MSVQHQHVNTRTDLSCTYISIGIRFQQTAYASFAKIKRTSTTIQYQQLHPIYQRIYQQQKYDLKK